MQRFLLGSGDASQVILSQFGYNHASCMIANPGLDVLPTFRITGISHRAETTLVTGTFSRPECVAVEERGWLFVSETASPSTSRTDSLSTTTTSSRWSGPPSNPACHCPRANPRCHSSSYDGGGAGKGGEAVLIVDGKEVGKKRIERTVAARFGIDTFGVGCDTGSPVCKNYKPPFAYSGVIEKVEILLGDPGLSEEEERVMQERFHAGVNY